MTVYHDTNRHNEVKRIDQPYVQALLPRRHDRYISIALSVGNSSLGLSYKERLMEQNRILAQSNRLRGFSAMEWLTLVAAALLLPLAGMLVSLCGVTRICRAIEAYNQRGYHRKEANNAAATVQLTARLVSAASQHAPYSGNCLTQALVLWCFLLCRKITTELRVGIARREGRLAGHAWLEHRGEPLGDPFKVQLGISPTRTRQES